MGGPAQEGDQDRDVEQARKRGSRGEQFLRYYG